MSILSNLKTLFANDGALNAIPWFTGEVPPNLALPYVVFNTISTTYDYDSSPDYLEAGLIQISVFMDGLNEAENYADLIIDKMNKVDYASDTFSVWLTNRLVMKEDIAGYVFHVALQFTITEEREFA